MFSFAYFVLFPVTFVAWPIVYIQVITPGDVGMVNQQQLWKQGRV